MNGVERIAAERQRQIETLGWTPEHDQEHDNQELMRAASCFLLASTGKFSLEMLKMTWPWPDYELKVESAIRSLEKAGALIAAEIDRLQASE